MELSFLLTAGGAFVSAGAQELFNVSPRSFPDPHKHIVTQMFVLDQSFAIDEDHDRHVHFEIGGVVQERQNSVRPANPTGNVGLY